MYIIEKIVSHISYINPHHKEMLGQKTKIYTLKKGEPMVFRTEDLGFFHTSYVIEFSKSNGTLIVETENSTYYMKEII